MLSRAGTLHGRTAINAVLARKRSRELNYRLLNEVWGLRLNRVAVRFAYERHDEDSRWFRSYDTENREFDNFGPTRVCVASSAGAPIAESGRRYLRPCGPRPADHSSLRDLGF